MGISWPNLQTIRVLQATSCIYVCTSKWYTSRTGSYFGKVSFLVQYTTRLRLWVGLACKHPISGLNHASKQRLEPSIQSATSIQHPISGLNHASKQRLEPIIQSTTSIQHPISGLSSAVLIVTSSRSVRGQKGMKII